MKNEVLTQRPAIQAYCIGGPGKVPWAWNQEMKTPLRSERDEFWKVEKCRMVCDVLCGRHPPSGDLAEELAYHDNPRIASIWYRTFVEHDALSFVNLFSCSGFTEARLYTE